MKTRAQKNQIIEKLTEKLNKYPCLIFAEYQGLKVSEVDALRSQIDRLSLPDAPSLKFEVVKNNLLKQAIKKTHYAGLLNTLTLKGPLAIMWSKDVVESSKILATFAKEHQSLKLKFGISDGKFISAREVIEISQLPSKEVLVGKLLGLLSSPIVSFVNVVNAPVKNLILLLNQKAKIKDK